MNTESKPQPLVWWVLWGAFLVGIFQVYYFLGIAGGVAKQATGPAAEPLLAVLGLLPVAGSVLVRWIVLPRIQNAQTALPFFILGIALAEASCFLGLFLFPAYKEGFFIFSVLGIFQFIPFFTRRYYTEVE